MATSNFLKKLWYGSLLAALWGFLLVASIIFSTWFYIKSSIQGEVVEVPDLTGLPVEQARATVETPGLVFEIDQDQVIHSNVIEKDRVFLQVPRKGSRIKTGRVVEVTLSAGPEKKRVPPLVGETLAFSQTLLGRVDLAPTILSRTPSMLAGKGRILSQVPEQGEETGLRPGVSLLLSEGPQQEWYVTPDFLNMDYDRAKAFLDENGIRVVTKYREADQDLGQIVLQQIPKAGYPLNKSQTMTLIVNKDY